MKRLLMYVKLLALGIKRAFERFPETLTVSMLFVVTVMMMIHADYDRKWIDVLEDIVLPLVVGIPLFANVKLLVERYGLSLKMRGILDGVALALIILYGVMIPEEITGYFMMRFFALVAILLIAFLCIPYFYDRKGLSQYILLMAGRFFLTILYSGVIFGGIAMMIFTVESLFGLDFVSEIYLDLFVIISGVFGVSFFLGTVPERDEDLAIEDYSKIFKTLFLYIVLPIISVYLVILYAYFVKILFDFDLPQGLIGNLVLWHAMVSAVTLFFVRDLRQSLAWLEKFFKIYIPLMVVPMGMFFLALWIRIDAYGITMPRYFVVALGIFALIGMGMMRLSKKDTALPVMIVLVTLVGISFFGPLSGYALTLRDQSSRLETMLKSNDMLSDSGDLIARPDLSESKQREVASQIQFLIRNYPVAAVSVLPSDFSDETSEAYLGFKLYGYWPIREGREYFYLEDHKNASTFALNGADYLVIMESYTPFENQKLSSSLEIEKQVDTQILVLKWENQSLGQIDLELEAGRFYENQASQPTFEFAVPGDEKSVEVKLIYRGMNGYLEAEDNRVIDYYHVWLLIDEKN
ncbi:DUF4153 domain-containing protein [Fusibacter tunisiensis]|uniref:DUF4153 domain-containing protein n=1 Tax=Fusibacter tunisiensis TaxID=1008308 RepID=A0ABS2MT00_9FIRM|nr:DUF4153 domain-containing protein [Fusibacter tunisiensis]MBM7562531.1 hypothetical protein [Fusibacter tunisiensis]